MVGGGMATQRVFVIWLHPIFYESVRLLLNHPAIQWVGATSDHTTVKDEILNLRPDTVLIEEEVEGDFLAKIVEILEACPWNMRVVGLGLADNKLTVYHREQRVAGKVDDLLDLILSGIVEKSIDGPPGV
jgi:hypothetical protein